MSDLTKGLNHATAVNIIRTENRIGVESVITKFDEYTAKKIHRYPSRRLRTFIPPRKKLSNMEHKVWRELQQNEEITIRPTDRRNATDVLVFDN